MDEQIYNSFKQKYPPWYLFPRNLGLLPRVLGMHAIGVSQSKSPAKISIIMLENLYKQPLATKTSPLTQISNKNEELFIFIQ